METDIVPAHSSYSARLLKFAACRDFDSHRFVLLRCKEQKPMSGALQVFGVPVGAHDSYAGMTAGTKQDVANLVSDHIGQELTH